MKEALRVSAPRAMLSLAMRKNQKTKTPSAVIRARKLQDPEARTARASFRQITKQVVALAVSCVPRDVVENYEYEDTEHYVKKKLRHNLRHSLYGPGHPTGPKNLGLSLVHQ